MHTPEIKRREISRLLRNPNQLNSTKRTFLLFLLTRFNPFHATAEYPQELGQRLEINRRSTMNKTGENRSKEESYIYPINYPPAENRASLFQLAAGGAQSLVITFLGEENRRSAVNRRQPPPPLLHLREGSLVSG